MEQLKVDTFVPDSKETAIFYMVFVCRLYLNWIVIGRKRAVVFSLVSQSNLVFFLAESNLNKEGLTLFKVMEIN